MDATQITVLNTTLMHSATTQITQIMKIRTLLLKNQVMLQATPLTLFSTVANLPGSSLMTHLTRDIHMNRSPRTAEVATLTATTQPLITCTEQVTVTDHQPVTLTSMIPISLLCTLAPTAVMTLTSQRTHRFTTTEMDVFHTLTLTTRPTVPRTMCTIATATIALMTFMDLPNTVVPVVTASTAVQVTIVRFTTTMQAALITATSPIRMRTKVTTTPTMDITTSPITVISTTTEQISRYGVDSPILILIP